MPGIGPQGSSEAVQQNARKLAANPRDLVARHNLAEALRKLGRLDEALVEVERAWADGLKIGQTALLRGSLLVQLGRLQDAETAFRDANRARPDLIRPAKALASLLPQLGRPEEALDGFREALQNSPQTGALWVEAMSAAKAQGDWRQLLDWALAAEQRFGTDPLIATFLATALSGQGRNQEACKILHHALAEKPDSASAQATLAHILIRTGDFRSAQAAALAATRLEPGGQWAWSLLGVIWRLLEDRREAWLCDYDRLVMQSTVDLPAGLPAALRARHVARAQPADQSLRGGTQTQGHLFHSPEPAIIELARRIEARVSAELERLKFDAGHPFLARLTGRFEFSASWSVRLADQGFHVSHIHSKGWLSSALYVALPAEVSHGGGQGVLTFGQPDAALGLDLPPRRVVQPREGRLVLFPSYLWHGTTPFSGTSPRLTVAFDALPVDNARATP